MWREAYFVWVGQTVVVSSDSPPRLSLWPVPARRVNLPPVARRIGVYCAFSGFRQFPNGRLPMTLNMSRSETKATLPNERLRLRLLFWSKCRLPCLRRSTLPVPVILNLLATALRVLAMPPFLVIEGRNLASPPIHASGFFQYGPKSVHGFRRRQDMHSPAAIDWVVPMISGKCNNLLTRRGMLG